MTLAVRLAADIDDQLARLAERQPGGFARGAAVDLDVGRNADAAAPARVPRRLFARADPGRVGAFERRI